MTRYSHFPRHAAFLLLLTLVAGVAGFALLANVAAVLAQILFGLFLLMFVLALIFGRRAAAPDVPDKDQPSNPHYHA